MRRFEVYVNGFLYRRDTWTEACAVVQKRYPDVQVPAFNGGPLITIYDQDGKRVGLIRTIKEAP